MTIHLFLHHQNPDMLDRESDYVKNYLERIGKISQDIVSQDYTNLQEYKMSDHYGYVENGVWYFKILKSKDTGICLQDSSEEFKILLEDPNIMCVGVNRFPPKSKVKEHVDPPYYGKKLWRILVPIKASDAYLKGMNGTQKVVSGNCYIFDITYEFHHGWNSSEDEDFVVATFDILYETDSDNVGEHYWSKYNGGEIYSKVLNIDLAMYEKVNHD